MPVFNTVATRTHVVFTLRSLVRLRQRPDGAVELGPAQAGVERGYGHVGRVHRLLSGGVCDALIGRLVEDALLQLVGLVSDDVGVSAGRDADHDAVAQDAVGAADRLLGLQPGKRNKIDRSERCGRDRSKFLKNGPLQNRTF